MELESTSSKNVDQNVDDRETASKDHQADVKDDTGSSSCHFSGFCQRFIILFFFAFLNFVGRFCYENPSALLNSFQTDLGLSVTEYTLLFSVYAWPTVILCFVGGFLVDRVFGVKLGMILYMFLLLSGQIIFATGVFYNNLVVMLVGRFLMGSGTESLKLTLFKYVVSWFRSSQLNVITGLQISTGSLGSGSSFWFMGSLLEWVQQFNQGPDALGILFFLTSSLCVVGMVFVLILASMKSPAEKVLKTTKSRVIRMADIKDFPKTYWLLPLIATAFHSSVSSFTPIAKTFFMEKFDLNPTEADNVNSIVFVISAVGPPMFGILALKTGRNLFITIIISALPIIGYSILNFTPFNPYIGNSIIGISNAAFTCITWPLVTLIIPEHQLGSAYGLKQSLVNLGYSIFVLLVGLILDKTNYFWTIVFLIGTAVVSTLVTLLLWSVDKRRGGILNMSAKQMDLQQERNKRKPSL